MHRNFREDIQHYSRVLRAFTLESSLHALGLAVNRRDSALLNWKWVLAKQSQPFFSIAMSIKSNNWIKPIGFRIPIESNKSASEYRLNRTNPLPISIESNKSASDFDWIEQIGFWRRLNKTNRVTMSIESNESASDVVSIESYDWIEWIGCDSQRHHSRLRRCASFSSRLTCLAASRASSLSGVSQNTQNNPTTGKRRRRLPAPPCWIAHHIFIKYRVESTEEDCPGISPGDDAIGREEDAMGCEGMGWDGMRWESREHPPRSASCIQHHHGEIINTKKVNKVFVATQRQSAISWAQKRPSSHLKVFKKRHPSHLKALKITISYVIFLIQTPKACV